MAATGSGGTGSGGAAKADEDAAQGMWGQRFGAVQMDLPTKNLVGQAPRPAAEPQLGAERYVSAGSAGDLVAGVLTNRVFNEAFATAFS